MGGTTAPAKQNGKGGASAEALAEALVQAEAAKAAAPTPEPAPEPEPTPEPTATADPAPEPTPDVAPPGETPKERRARIAAQQAAKAVKEARYTPDDGCEWVEVEGLGDISVCTSSTGFYYVVFRGRGREHAIPLIAIEKLQEAGQV